MLGGSRRGRRKVRRRREGESSAESNLGEAGCLFFGGPLVVRKLCIFQSIFLDVY